MKKVETCPICLHMGKIMNVYLSHEAEQKTPPTNPMNYIYNKCNHCNAFEVGNRPGEKGNIYRIGLFVVTASGEIHLGEDAVKKIIEETIGLLADYRYKGYLDKVAENPFDNAIGAIMLDAIEDGDEEFKHKYPKSYDALVRRRLKVQGKWEPRAPSPIL